MTWTQLSQDNYAASQSLLEEGHSRSCISRAYYAVYAAVAEYFSSHRKISFSFGGNNPSHDQMLSLLLYNLDVKSFGQRLRRDLQREVREMQRRRIVADYVPSRAVDFRDARDQVRSASFVLQALEKYA